MNPSFFAFPYQKIICPGRGEQYMGSGKLFLNNGRLRFQHIIPAAVLLLLVCLILLPFKIPYSVKAYGRIMPAKRWVLARDADGQLVTSLFDYKVGRNFGYGVAQFAREGAMNFAIDSIIRPGRVISAGDTVGSINSTDSRERLVQLQGQLETARADLDISIRGEKEATVEEFEQKLTHARERYDNQLRIVERLREMYRQNLISQQEYEIADGEARLMEIEVSIAASQLSAMQTGEKPEQINLLRTRIHALQREIETLQKRIDSFSILSPLDGVISRVYSSDTLLIVSDTTSYIVFIATRYNEYPKISRGQAVEIDVDGVSAPVRCQVISTDDEIRILNGEQTFVTVAETSESNGQLPAGMVVKCSITCKPISAFDYVKGFINRLAVI